MNFDPTSGTTAGYSVLHDGRRVARVGSVAGLLTATRGTSSAQPAIVSFAYVLEGEAWFAAWGEGTSTRSLEVHDERSGRSYALEVARVFDASRTGLIYEAEVVSARER